MDNENQHVKTSTNVNPVDNESSMINNLENKHSDTMKWYTLQVRAGNEKSVKDALIESVKKNDVSNMFGDFFIPVIQFEEQKRGKKVVSEQKLMPGYIFIKMHMDEHTWNLVKDIPKVSNFLGDTKVPMPVKDAEMEQMFKKVRGKQENFTSDVEYALGDYVRILDGAFDTFSGSVNAVDNENKKVSVSVSIFGRDTFIDLNFDQIVKIR